MRWYGKEITVAKGENFSLTCKITNRDGTPYMISSTLPNPAFLLTVANTLYKSDDDRYVLNCWTPLVVNIPDAVPVQTLIGCTDTTVVYLLTQSETIDEVYYPVGYYKYDGEGWNRYSEYVNGFIFDETAPRVVEDLDIEHNEQIDTRLRLLYKLTKPWPTENPEYEPGYYIYLDGEWKPYETIFMQNFPSKITNKWINKNFYYELRLVAGELTEDFKRALIDNDISSYEGSPFSDITNEYVLIPKTQLNVLSKLGGY